MQQKLRIAIVGGSGLIGKRHCQHVAANPSADLIAIVDPSPAAIEIAKLHRTMLFPTLQALFDSAVEVDAAIVCTPNHTHVPIASELAKAGIHILCEKPISIDIESGRSLVNIAQEHGVKLLIGHHRRFNPYMLKAKKIVDSGILGDVTAVNGLWTTIKPDDYFAGEALSWRSSRSRGGGVILINFIHEIDLMHYLFGPVTRIHAEKTISRREHQGSDPAEEGAAITLRFASRIVGTFIIADNVASPHSFEQGTGENPMLPQSGLDVYRIFGTRGTLSFPDMTLSSYGNGKVSWLEKISSQQLEIENMDVAPFDSQLNHFIAVCRGEEQPSCTGEEGLRALAVCEAIREALASADGGATINIG